MITKSLDKISDYPLTVVEAPSGFGKTTAIRDYAKTKLSLGAHVIWYTCMGETIAETWHILSSLVSAISSEFADKLSQMELPREIMFISPALSEIKCSRETYIIIDNFQLFDYTAPYEFLNRLSTHENPDVHVIVLCQNIMHCDFSFHNDCICRIGTSVLNFDIESTAKLFRLEGVSLSRKKLEAVYGYTQGWISAIHTQIQNYKEHGIFGQTANLERLVETAIWSKLTNDEKDILQSVALMDTFDARQAAIMTDKSMLHDKIDSLLKRNEFIHYHINEKTFQLHSVLREFLLNRFYYCLPNDIRREALHKVGQCYATVSQFFTAAKLFYEAGDFDAIFSLPVRDSYIGNQKEDNVLGFIRDIIEHCPEQTLLKYPSVLIKFCSYLCAGGYFGTYRKLRQLIEKSIENGNLETARLYRLKNEYFIMNESEKYVGVIETGIQQKRLPFFLGESTNIKREIPFTFGCPSVLYLLWREEGTLENDMNDLSKKLPIYFQITQGHGWGADSLMKAEAMLMRGQDKEAVCLCHMTLYEAKTSENQQICICLGAEFVLARVAILRGDVDGYFSSRTKIENYSRTNSDLYVKRMVELCLTGLNYIIGETEMTAPWIKDLDSIRNILYYPVIPYALIFYLNILMNRQQYDECLGIFEGVMHTAARHNLLSKIYFLKYISIINLKNGNRSQAQMFYNQAVSISLADKVFLPLAQHAEETNSLLLLAKSEISDKDGVETLISLGKRQTNGVSAIKRAIFQEQSPLTPREREIALLVKERLSAQEIAETLYISKATVKTMMRNLYRKLNIHSRSELAKMKFF